MSNAEYKVLASDQEDGKEVTILTSSRQRALLHAMIFQTKSRYVDVRVEYDSTSYPYSQLELLP